MLLCHVNSFATQCQNLCETQQKGIHLIKFFGICHNQKREKKQH